MQTQVQCPNCSTPYTTDVHQIIDVGQNPELKQLLLSGQLNLAVCPSCGTGGQLSTILLYHDPEHELFMLYTPQEMQLDQVQREQYIGRLTKQILDNTPPEQRRGYMLQPTNVLTMQSFMEKVLETEGITKDMIERQRKQTELISTLAQADPDVVDYLVEERASEIDETFFAMLRSYVERAMQSDDNNQVLPLINLQAKLMTETAVGQQIEKRQIALHALNQDARSSGGLTPVILLRHVLKNQDDMALVESISQAGASAMTYEFFTGLTAEIDKQEMAGNQDRVNRLKEIRTNLLKMQEEMRQASEQILQDAQRDLESILAAENIEQAVQANMSKFDDAFMYVLSASIDRAESNHEEARLEKLNVVQELIARQADDQTPPEIRLLTQLMFSESDEETQNLLNENQDLLSADMVTVVDMLQDQVRDSGQSDLVERLGHVKELIVKQLA
ncbi:MAG: CpXC domain-containing protein [Candidatus Promineifilaceae bacterium]|nr:CpXC domain-containing protein [Candidatus Promineifilaceae bacterium]